MEILVFNRWSIEGIKVEDPGLERYITLKPTFVPRTGGQFIGTRFKRSKTFIVERFMNKIMVTGHRAKKHKMSSGHHTGKAHKVYKIFEETLGMIENRLKTNPIVVLIKAIENAAPREEIVTIEYGGARYPKAVECSPQRRIDLAIRLMTQGAYASSFKKKRKMAEALAEEIILAYQLNMRSNAISKKNELERQADSSR